MRDVAAALHKQLDMDAEKDERRGLKRKISTTRCDVCEAEEAKYRCPSCQKCSCSLPCVKQHKLQSGCSGVRDRTAFVALSRFSDLDLLSDYRFLEETGRIADGPNRDTLLHTSSHHSFGVKMLLRNARAANVTLKLLPKSFSRRRENTSFFHKTFPIDGETAPLLPAFRDQQNSDQQNFNKELCRWLNGSCDKNFTSRYSLNYFEYQFASGHPGMHTTCKEKKLYWYLKLFFPHSNAEYSSRVPDDRVLEKILSHYIHPTESDPVKRQNLKMYVVTPIDQLSVFMKSELRLPNSLKYHELDLKKTLRENLMFKTVMEYPELHVVVKEQRCEEYHARIPDRSIISTSPSCSSEARGAPESRTARPENQTAALSDLEEGEIRSEDEEEDDQNTARNVSCAVFKNDEDDEVSTSVDQNLTRKSDDASSPPHSPNEYDDGDLQHTAASECLVPPSSDKDVEEGINSPALHDADCLPSCSDDVTKHASGLMEVDAAPLHDDICGDGRTSVHQNLSQRLNQTSPQHTLNESDEGDVKNTESSGLLLPHSHSKNTEDVEGYLESPAVQDALCLPSCTDISKKNSDSMDVDRAPLSLHDDDDQNEGSDSVDQNVAQNLAMEAEGAPHTLPDNLYDGGSTSVGPNPTNDPPPTSRTHVDEDVEGHIDDLDSPAVHDAVCLPFCSKNVTKENRDSLRADDASPTLPVAGCDGSTCVDQSLTKGPYSSPPPSAVDRNDECLLPHSSDNVDVERHFGDLHCPAVQDASCRCCDGHQADMEVGGLPRTPPKDDEVSTSVDQNLTRKSDDASSPPHSPNEYDDGDLQHTAASECLVPPSSDKDVEEGINSPALHDADCLPSCSDDVTKHASGLMEVDAAPLHDDICGDGRTSVHQNLTQRLNQTSPHHTLNESDEGDVKNTESSGLLLPHSHSKNTEDVEGYLESPAVQDASCRCCDGHQADMEVGGVPRTPPKDDEGSTSVDQNPKPLNEPLSLHAPNYNTSGSECLPHCSSENIKDVEGHHDDPDSPGIDPDCAPPHDGF